MGTGKREFFVYEVYLGERLRHLVSPLEPDDVAEHGLSAEAVVGLLAVGVDGPGAMQPDHFEENPTFVRFLHETIGDDIFVVHGIREQAALVGGHGWVDVLDARTPDPAGEVPEHDVIGSVEVRDGELVPMSYRANEHHRLLTEDGFFQLPEELEMALLKRLHAT
ncbi:hypothetical protein OHA72_60900 [Dactylosporangium sp. NBC_01737]|uniref:hypothetical protein n=1 Tax=Dactylosporangium sp. NBC_01737 TaxID=2975959 RepID=UPI002E13CDE9|nr:hypothetical protein OHA72_60900 [Dactylosporangium sp. NBC_01737]